MVIDLRGTVGIVVAFDFVCYVLALTTDYLSRYVLPRCINQSKKLVLLVHLGAVESGGDRAARVLELLAGSLLDNRVQYLSLCHFVIMLAVCRLMRR